MRRRQPRPWLRASFALGMLSVGARLLAGPPGPRSGADPEQAAREVFGEPDFWWKRIERVEYSPSWPARILRAIGDLLEKVLDRVWDFLKWLFKLLFDSFAGDGDWSAGTPLIWLFSAILAAWALWKFLPYLVHWLQKGDRAGETGPLRYEQLPEARRLLAQAGAACDESRYAEAVRLALLALIAHFQQQGLLRYDPTRTNREYRLDLQPAPDLASIFGECALPFERIWYGRFPATHGDADRVLELCRSVVGEDPRP